MRHRTKQIPIHLLQQAPVIIHAFSKANGLNGIAVLDDVAPGHFVDSHNFVTEHETSSLGMIITLYGPLLQKKNLRQKFRDLLEPSVAGPTIVNDGSIFLALGIW